MPELGASGKVGGVRPRRNGKRTPMPSLNRFAVDRSGTSVTGRPGGATSSCGHRARRWVRQGPGPGGPRRRVNAGSTSNLGMETHIVSGPADRFHGRVVADATGSGQGPLDNLGRLSDISHTRSAKKAHGAPISPEVGVFLFRSLLLRPLFGGHAKNPAGLPGRVLEERAADAPSDDHRLLLELEITKIAHAAAGSVANGNDDIRPGTVRDVDTPTQYRREV